MYKEIIVDVNDDETRVAVMEDQQLMECYIERAQKQRLVGNIYKGRVENVLPGMQAAFVDIGLEKNAFLYVEDALSNSGAGPNHGSKTHIGDILKKGQEIIVQIVKEPIGSKGPRVTTNITLPGRYLVLMPTVDYIGISRRIEKEEERERLRQAVVALKPEGMGAIVRTVAEGVEAEEIKRDMQLLVRLWTKVQNKFSGGPVPNLLHRDLELIHRILRDVFNEDVDRLLVDSRNDYEKIIEYLEVLDPSLKVKIYFEEKDDIFEKMGIENELQKSMRRRVWLKCGAYLVIDQAEALTAIDVNTGKYVGSTNLEDTVLKTNLEAAVEIARQLRLRNLGGIIIIDFIDMMEPPHQQQVLQALENAIKKDKTKTNVLGLTQLGLVEMTRKKVRSSLSEVMQKPCPYCEGRGKVVSEETMSSRLKTKILQTAKFRTAESILVEAHPLVASRIIGSGGSGLRELEKNAGKKLFVRGCAEFHIEQMNIRALTLQEELELNSVPVSFGEEIEVVVEETHSANDYDGIARLNGFIIDIEGGGSKVGEKVRVVINKINRTYAKATLI